MKIHLEPLAGNEALKRLLSAQGEGRGFGHAYLISGPAGSGKRTLARLMAAALVCTGTEDRPCGRCPACRKALAGIHPDVMTLGGEKEISVAQARFVRSDAYIRPNEAGRKVYILENAQSMNASAQNALLKLLEEGPDYAVFLLLAENPSALLATIRSRCELLALSPVSPSEAEAYLTHRFPQLEPQQIKEAVLGCSGWLGQAIGRLESHSASADVQEAAGRLLALLAQGDELALASWCVCLESWDREELEKLLEQALALLRDTLALQAGAALPQNSRLPVLRQARALERKKLLSCTQILAQLRGSIEFHVGTGHLCGALAARLSQAIRP